MKSVLKDFAKRSLYYAGYYGVRRRIFGPRGHRLLILMYHDLSPDPRAGNSGSHRNPDRSDFNAHLRAITRHYRLVSLRRAIDEIRTEGKLRTDSVAITFDDGHPAVYSIAYPLLRRYNVPATVFLLTGWINREIVYWWQNLRHWFDQAAPEGLSVEPLNAALGFEVSLGEDPPSNITRSTLCDIVEHRLVDMPDADRLPVLERLRQLLLPSDGRPVEPTRALTWDQILLMADHKIEFEAHTRTHINMKYTDATTAEREIVDSRDEIQNRLQREVTGFCYPYGKDIDAYRDFEPVLQRLGFSYAVNAVSGSNSERTNLYSLFRGTLPHSRSRSILGRYLALLFSTEK